MRAGRADSLPRTLEHPLPAGMRDLLPEEAAERRGLARSVLSRIALYGYAVVTLPVFEFAEVLERGLGQLDPADVLRFVEPESGEVAALRPDMTPQIARVVATRLRERPAPFRLAYEGTVVRRRSGRARKHKQIPQVGAELAGVAGPEGDLELLSLAADAIRAAGLERFTIDIGDAGIVRALLSGHPPEEREALSDALSRKDASAVGDAVLRETLSLCGGRDALVEGTRLLARTAAAGAAARLLALYDAAVAQGLGAHIVADVGEVRGFAYYTGAMFHAYATGTGDAIGSGGRYDELLARFGFDLPAAGFALDLDRVLEARAAAGVVEKAPLRVAVVNGPMSGERVAELRARGIVAVRAGARAEALAWARAWSFSHVLDGEEWVDAASGDTIPAPGFDHAPAEPETCRPERGTT
jgi:ATP phosphoribosyltransferase regulatory subunit